VFDGFGRLGSCCLHLSGDGSRKVGRIPGREVLVPVELRKGLGDDEAISLRRTEGR
jgi:hypothetical protein